MDKAAPDPYRAGMAFLAELTGFGRVVRAGAGLASREQVIVMLSRRPIRWAVLAGLALWLSVSLTVVSSGHQAGKPQPPARAGAAAASLLPVADVLADVPALQVARPFDIGYTVNDLQAVMTQFTDVLGIQWAPLETATLNIRFENGLVKPIDFTIAESQQGPPYIELAQGIQGSGDNPYVTSPNFSPGHTGFAVHNLAAASDALVAAGFPRIATVDVPGQDAFLFALHQGPAGINIELVDAAFTPPGVCDTPGSLFCPPNA
jgi:hypothetical protein